jgi:hypothetical protein
MIAMPGLTRRGQNSDIKRDRDTRSRAPSTAAASPPSTTTRDAPPWTCTSHWQLSAISLIADWHLPGPLLGVQGSRPPGHR